MLGSQPAGDVSHKLLSMSVFSLFSFSVFHFLVVGSDCLQCFDAVGWAAGRASGL